MWDWWGIFTLFPFTLQYWMSINYTYEGNMMSVHIKISPYYRYNLSRTHFARLIWNLCTVHFHSTVLYVYYLHLWKQYDVFVHIKSSLYYRYNWSRTHFVRLIRNLYIVHFHSTVLDVYYLHLWKQYDVFVHIKSSLYYRYNLSRTHFARLIRNQGVLLIAQTKSHCMLATWVQSRRHWTRLCQ